MSECVVRMEMPTSCEECPLVQTDENDWGDVMSRTCNLIYKGYLSDVPKGERRADCPIICSLPEGHGRLVDKDEMLKKIENYHRYMTIGRESDPRCIIEDSPTIVPSEAERSET